MALWQILRGGAIPYIEKSRFYGKTPEARERQLANLRQNRGKSEPSKPKQSRTSKKALERLDIIEFIEEHFYIPETRKPMVLLGWQKDILRDLFYLDVKPSLAILGMCKKSGKSTLAAAIALCMLIRKPNAEIYIMGPDLQQGQLVTFDKLCKAIRLNPVLKDIVKVKTDRIEYNDGYAMILPCSKTSAGLNPDLVIFDELWQFTSIEAKRAIDEMTTVPTKEMLTLVVTYAGYEDETDTHLYQWYQQGIAQAEGKEEKDPSFYFLWRADYEGVPWVTDKYLASQKRRLRENTYRRLHRNEWVCGEEAFIEGRIIDLAVIPNHRPGSHFLGPVGVGLDIGYAHDCSAIALVGWMDPKRLLVVDHSVFVPPEDEQLDIEKTVEKRLCTYADQFDIGCCFFDPFQAIRTAQTLIKRGIPMVEYPQTGKNCVRMTETLQGLFKSGNLKTYRDEELRQHLLNSKVKESDRGWRLVKRREKQKIDLAVALAMACQAAVDRVRYVPRRDGINRPERAETEYEII